MHAAGRSSRRPGGAGPTGGPCPRGTRPIWAQRMVSPLWWNSSPRRQVGRSALVEGQVDDGALRPEAAQGAGQGGRRPRHWKTTSAPAVGRAVAPALLDHPPGGAVGVVDRRRGRAPRRRPAGPGWRRPPPPRRRRGGGRGGPISSPTTPAPVTSTWRPRDAVAERSAPGPRSVGGRVQQPVGADRAHVGDVDAEHRVEVGRQGHGTGRRRVGGVAGLVAVGHGDQVAHGHGVAAGLDRPARPPCSRGADREAGRRPVAAAEHPQPRRPRPRAGTGWCP